MPWSRAGLAPLKIRADETGAEIAKLNAIFNACFRIQREASEAAGRYVPMVVENVRGAIPWVGRSRWNFGSYHLWGDVPALMPPIEAARQSSGHGLERSPGRIEADQSQPAAQPRAFNGEATKLPGFRFDGSGQVSRRRRGGASARAARISAMAAKSTAVVRPGACTSLPSASPRRKAASARIAMIPQALSEWIGRVYLP